MATDCGRPIMLGRRAAAQLNHLVYRIGHARKMRTLCAIGRFSGLTDKTMCSTISL